eukprot:GHVU01225138.1.p1 GENE.GHVU01225138.1~~GHVU01225138.1.p1  ORF type:complete len:165 (+),score=32.61 GHVU01225138.1:1372-1866(+)
MLQDLLIPLSRDSPSSGLLRGEFAIGNMAFWFALEALLFAAALSLLHLAFRDADSHDRNRNASAPSASTSSNTISTEKATEKKKNTPTPQEDSTPSASVAGQKKEETKEAAARPARATTATAPGSSTVYLVSTCVHNLLTASLAAWAIAVDSPRLALPALMSEV